MPSPTRPLALALAGALTVGLALAPTPALAATTTIAITPDDVAQSRYIEFVQAGVARSSEFVQIDLAEALDDIDIVQQLNYYVDNGFETFEGVQALSGTTITVPISSASRPAGTEYSVSLFSSALAPDALSIVLPIVAFDFISGSPTASVDLTFFGRDAEHTEWFVDLPATVIDVVQGDQIVLDASTLAFWNGGPDGSWSGGSVADTSTIGADSRATLPMQGILNGSGDQLTQTIQRPHWHFVPGRVLSLSIERTWSSGTRSAAVFASLPVRFPSPAPTPTIDRISGADRFEVANDIAREAFPSGAFTVFLTNGLNYPDALSAAPAAARYDAPLLLTTPGGLPASTAQALADLDPSEVIIVGGPNSVSATVVSQVEAITGAGSTRRLGGTDRFDASRTIARDAFDADNTPVAYIATGFNFPDALSAGSAAGSISAPVVLVNGSTNALDAATLQLFDDLGVSSVRIAGGPNSVSSAIETQLMGLGFETSRLSGADRFEASSNIGRDGFLQADRVFIATGLNFPDALAGAAWAAREDAPLITIPGTCIPSRVLADLQGYRLSQITVLGGPNSVSAGAAALTPCSGFAWPEF